MDEALPTALVDQETATRDRGEILLTVGQLRPGAFGVLRVVVDRIQPVHTFTRKDGTEGVLRRVTLADATGEVDMVLWGDEVHLAVDGDLQPGRAVTLRGATVKDGWKGGIELGLGAAVVEPAAAATDQETLEGRLVSLGDTEVLDGPRFRAEAVIETAEGPVHVIAWDEAIRDLLGNVGASVSVDGHVHPVLDGWFVAGDDGTDGAPQG